MLRLATKQKVKLKLGLFGVSGSGKTMSALRLAYGLCGDWSKIAVIDSESISDQASSSELYSGYKSNEFGIGQFNILPLRPPYDPQRYINAIYECEKAGMEVIIIDSISHEWEGKGGCLETAKRFQDWKDVGNKHTEFVEKIKNSSSHIIACARVKTKYNTVEVEKQGKKSFEVAKSGEGIVTREGFDYELITAFDVTHSHLATTSKDRTGLFSDCIPFLITEETGKQLLEWANEGILLSDEPKPESDLKAYQTDLKLMGADLEDGTRLG